MYEVLFCFCILLHWRVFLPLVESSCQIWFPMLTFAFLSLPLLRKTDVKIRKQTEKRETKRKQETVFYVFLRVSLANIGKFKLSLKALILSAFTFICFLVFSNVFCRTKIFHTSFLLSIHINLVIGSKVRWEVRNLFAQWILFSIFVEICAKKSCLRNDCIIKKSGYGALISITLYINRT